MIDRQHGKVIFVCDACEEKFEGERSEPFDAVWATAKRNGWTVRKINNEWLHGCPECGAPM